MAVGLTVGGAREAVTSRDYFLPPRHAHSIKSMCPAWIYRGVQIWLCISLLKIVHLNLFIVCLHSSSKLPVSGDLLLLAQEYPITMEVKTAIGKLI